MLICSYVLAAMHLNKDVDLHLMTRLIERPCTVGRPSKSRMPIGIATHEAEKEVLTLHDAVKFIGSRLSCKLPDDGRVYVGTIHGVFEGRDHNKEQTIIYRIAYPPQYPDQDEPIFEEFTHNRMVQGMAHYKEFEKKNEASKRKAGTIHFD